MDQVEIKLPTQLDLAALPALKEELVNAVTCANGVLIDGANVERISTPAIQLLLATEKALLADGRCFALANATDVLSSALCDLGLEPELTRWSAR